MYSQQEQDKKRSAAVRTAIILGLVVAAIYISYILINA